MPWGVVQNACVSFAERVRAHKLTHIDQPYLTKAVEIAVKRNSKDGRWAWGKHPNEQSTVAPLTAASLAAYAVIHWPVRVRPQAMLV